MELVRQFEEKARRTGRHSLIGDAQRFAEELGMKLELRCPDPSGTTEQGEVTEGRKILSRFMYNILNSISFVNLYTELATVIRLAVVVVFFLNLASRCVQLP